MIWVTRENGIRLIDDRLTSTERRKPAVNGRGTQDLQTPAPPPLPQRACLIIAEETMAILDLDGGVQEEGEPPVAVVAAANDPSSSVVASASASDDGEDDEPPTSTSNNERESDDDGESEEEEEEEAECRVCRGPAEEG